MPGFSRQLLDSEIILVSGNPTDDRGKNTIPIKHTEAYGPKTDVLVSAGHTFAKALGGEGRPFFSDA